MFHIDFENPEPQIICHDQYKDIAPRILEGLKEYDLKDHFILFSSGTTGGDLKGYAVSKKALFANAKAVNEHFGLTSDDIWGLSLPVYHIGGLSVVARAHLLKNCIVDLRQWNVDSWYSQIQDVTITTIVPTQLYDLVQKNLRAPEKLKYIIVGGDLLSSELKKEALKLGWPVIRTFGMSEVCSQLASAKKPESDDMEILPIHSVKIEDDRLLVKSEALFTLEFTIGKEFLVTEAPKDYYVTKDRAEIKGNIIRHLGRVGDDYKIAGHLVNLNILRDQLSTYLVRNDLYNQMEFSIQDNERKGKKLVLLSLKEIEQDTISEISKLISPVKIDEVKVVPNFERTALGKLKKI